MRIALLLLVGIIGIPIAAGCTEHTENSVQAVQESSKQLQDPASSPEQEPKKEVITWWPSVYTWPLALEAGAELLNTEQLSLGTKNTGQETLAKYYKDFAGKELKLPEGQVIEGIASKNIDDVNGFLREHGIDGQLQPNTNPTAWFAAAVLKLSDKWYGAKGKKREITLDEKKYPGVQLKESQQVCFFQAKDHPYPVVNLWTEGEGSLVYATKLPKGFVETATAASATELAAKLTPKEEDEWHNPDRYTHAIIPMVDMDVEVQSDWILGLGIEQDTVDQALQAFQFQLNEFGFAAKDGVALGASRGMPPPEKNYVIDGPFLFWVTGENLTHPVLAVIVEPKFWKNPVKSKH